MPGRVIRLNGVYNDIGILKLNDGRIVELSEITGYNDLPQIPFGTKVEINIIYDEKNLINGYNGIVWATYNINQAEMIKTALLVQNIFSEIKEIRLDSKLLHIVHIAAYKEVDKAVDFIWRDSTGLRLKPDWHYKTNAENESFKKWIDGQ